MADVPAKRGKPGEPGNINGIAADVATRWQKGKSGNPNGRPSYAKALDANGTNSAELLEKLIRKASGWVDDNSDTKRQAYAHLWLTERILRIGRPKEEMDVNVAGPSAEQVAILEALRLTPHERRKALEAQDSTARDDDDDSSDSGADAELAE